MNWKIWTAFISVFIAGVAVGVVGVALFLHFHFAPPKNPKMFQERIKSHILKSIINEVHPDATQIAEIKVILEQTAKNIEKLRTEHGPKVRAVLDENDRRIRAVLTPEQIQRFDAMLDDFRKHKFSLFRLPPPMPPMPPHK